MIKTKSHTMHHTRRSRRGNILSSTNINTVFLLGLWISNSIIGCQAIPRPHPLNSDEDVALGAPLISPLRDEAILEVQTYYEMRCECNEPIIWKLPVNYVPHEINTFATGDTERPFGSDLRLSNISYHNVGSYYCIKKSQLSKSLEEMSEKDFMELVDQKKASMTYVFVNDKEHLLAPIEIQVGYGMEYQDITIPCKPTMPTVEVNLTIPDGIPNGQNLSSVANAGRYHPKLGFVIEMLSDDYEGIYTCHPKEPSPDNKKEETKFLLRYHDPPMASKSKKSTTKLYPAKTSAIASPVTAATEANLKYELIQKSTVTNPVNATNSNVVVTIGVGVDIIDVGIGDDYKQDGGGYRSGYEHEIDEMPTTREMTIERSLLTATSITTSDDNDNDDEIVENGNDVADIDDVEDVSNDVKESGEANFKVVDVRSLKKRSAQTTVPTPRRSSHNRSTPRPNKTFLSKPQITSSSKGHAYEDDTFVLECQVKIEHGARYSAEWQLPPEVDESRVERTETTFKKNVDTHNLGSALLTVKNAKKSDSGMYTCIVIDHSNNKLKDSYEMKILETGDGYIELREPVGHYDIEGTANSTIKMNVIYRGHPPPILTWFRPDGSEILNTDKYKIDTTEKSSLLRILNTQMVDSGQYVLQGRNDLSTQQVQFKVSIKDKPIVTVEDVYVEEGEDAHLTCRILAYPSAVVNWVFTPCKTTPYWPSCEEGRQMSLKSTHTSAGNLSIEYFHKLNFMTKNPGEVRCVADNVMGQSKDTAHVFIIDIGDNVTIYGVDEARKIARGDEVTITCAALAYFFSDEIIWYKDLEPVTESDDIKLSSSRSDYSYKKSLTFRNITHDDRGSYECRAKSIVSSRQDETRVFDIVVHEPSLPKIISTNLDSSVLDRKLGEPLELECKSEAIPSAKVVWYKDGNQLNSSMTIEEDTKLVIPYIRPEDEGVYKCVVSNRLGVVDADITVNITDMPGLSVAWILGILFILLTLIVLVIYLCIRVNRERKLLRELKAAGLANFEEGAVEHINPALTLDEQADLLPYDRNFEFPREKLKLGKQLGAGAFGVVLKAHAEGIKPDERETVVAVKMVKRTADNEVMRALVSELKIMVHLGQHLNVVNLLGAVTKNIAKRELMVIVEYCRYGNVQNLLLRNRKRFINQIHPETDRIDPTITIQRFSDNFELNRDGVKYVNLSFPNHHYINHVNNNYTVNNRRSSSENDPRSGTRAGRPNSSNYLRQSDLYEGHVDSGATEQTVMTTIPEDDDNILSNNSVQPAWRSNYKPDSTEAMTITTSDLVSWAFQVARGMDYLSSRKVLHGDLAARNILLCEDNVVKICDFGLARSMYKSDNYKKQGEAPLPIKWLALESLSDHVFSTYTDVWSFGIVLWEFFSLAKVPYPGMDPNQSLYLKLKDGYRMEKPPFANDDLYDIMLECWSTNPESRPLFNVLEKRFARMLGDEVTNHYLDLNEPYLRCNNEYMKRTPTDYLALMGPPDEMAPSPPKYVNGHILPEIRINASSDDYLNMSPDTGNAIFSPTRPKESESSNEDEPNSKTTTSFTFPDAAEQHSPTMVNNFDSPVNKNRRKDILPPEEIPMLQKTNGHASDSDENSPEEGRKFRKVKRQAPTPSPRHTLVETKLNGDDNYVNVKSPQKLLNNNGAKRAPDAFSNPSYQMLKSVNEAGDK